MGLMKRWDGNSWEDYVPKRWNGSSWINAIVRRWNGSSWAIISEQTLTETWNATWSQSYNGAVSVDTIYRTAKWGDTVSHYAVWYNHTWNQIVDWNNLKSPHLIYAGIRYIVDKKEFPRKRETVSLYQGRTSEDDRGRHRSMVGFNYGDIASTLKGSTIEKVEIYLRNQGFWNNNGKAKIGYHNSSSEPNDFQQSKYGQKTEDFDVGQGKWITLPDDFGNLLRDGKAKGFTLFEDSDSLASYGYFHGHSSGDRPQIRITYKK